MEDNQVTQSLDLSPFAISEDLWVTLRAALSTTTDEHLLEQVYEFMGEMEMQLAYVCHIIDERMKDLR